MKLRTISINFFSKNNIVLIIKIYVCENSQRPLAFRLFYNIIRYILIYYKPTYNTQVQNIYIYMFSYGLIGIWVCVCI